MEETLRPVHEISLGKAWAGSSVNCKVYATEPMVFAQLQDGRSGAFGAYFDDHGALVCYRWQPLSDALKTVVAAVPNRPNDAHFTASVQLDAQDTLHVVGGAHRNLPFHYLWRNGGDADRLEDVSDALPKELLLASYPSLLRVRDGVVSDQLFLLYRLGLPHRSQWRVMCRRDDGLWDTKSKPLLSGTSSTLWSAGPYPNQPLLFGDGRVGLVYCWRSHDVERGRTNPMNIGLDYAEFSDSFGTVRSSGGLRLALPVAPANSERIIPVRWGADLTNQSGTAVLSDGTPTFASTWREPGEIRQIQFCWRTPGGAWRHRPITHFTQDHQMEGGGTLPAPYSRPSVVPATEGRVIVLYRDAVSDGRLLAQTLSPPNFDPEHHPVVTLVEGGLDQYEPVADRLGTFQSGLLICYVQRAEQVMGGDKMLRHASTPARLLAWDINIS